MSRTCEKCGGKRTGRRDRFLATFSDITESSAAFDQFRLCRVCWSELLDDLREEVRREVPA